MSQRHSVRAFTLIELLVAIGLMTILMSMISVIFFSSSELFRRNDASQRIAASQRTALDLLARDLGGFVPESSGQQQLTLTDVPSRVGDDGENIVADPASPTPDGAADAIEFVATTSFRGMVSTVQLAYRVELSTDPEVMNDAGTPRGVRTGRKLMSLKRIARRQVGNAWEVDEADLCEYVLSFNLEALVDPDGTGPASPRFAQLDQGPFASAPRALRVTMRVVEGGAEARERLVSRVLWLPTE